MVKNRPGIDTQIPVEDTQSLQAIVEKSLDGLLVVNSHRRICFLNPSAKKFLNCENQNLINTIFEYPLQPGRSIEIDIVRDGGKPGKGEMRVSPIEWEGKPAFLVSIQDITERVIYDHLKDEFISNVSHELRTPLTVIREAVAQVYDGLVGKINEEQKRYLSICLRNADRLRRIVDDLLDLSKIEAGKVRLQKKKMDLNELAQTTLSGFSPLAEKKGLTLRSVFQSTTAPVYVDKDRIIQVLTNLIGNALKFTENGFIEVRVENKEDKICCAVKDTGIGIAPEDIPKIFDKFEQIGKASQQGTGLGLPIAREIVRLHGGEMAVESVPNQGSTFSFVLPQYTPRLEQIEKIHLRMCDSKEPFTLFSVFIHNLEEKRKTSGNPIVELSQKRCLSLIESRGERIEPIFTEAENVWLFIVNGISSDSKWTHRLKRLVKEAFDISDDLELDFSYALAKFPKEGQDAEELLHFCETHQVHERTERLSKPILLVDDERELTEAVKTLLGFFGYKNIETAQSGEEAFNKIKVQIPELIILDMKMPGMSGYEVIGRLKEDHKTKDIPILIMSGYEVEIGRFDEYITSKAILTVNKPVDPDLLRKTVYYLI